MPDRVRAVRLSVADVTPWTRWLFVEIETEEGRKGVGEGSLAGREQDVADAVRALAPALFRLAEADPLALQRPALDGLVGAAAFSAVDQALWDLAAQRQQVRLADALGTVRRDRIPLYANVNRRTRDRLPSGFAASAQDALAAGHQAIKIAPFDEATPASPVVEPGLARIRAVRDAIGPERRLMVDCHWRLDEPASRRVIEAAAEIGVHWVECPLPETAANIPTLVRLRGLANARGVLTAGCEKEIGLAGFEPFLSAGAYDVLMPDAKYVGGLVEMLRVAQRMQRAGAKFSPHNPSGPVCHAVSLHLCAVVPDLHSLETQFDESPLFDTLVGQRLQHAEAGMARLPEGVGLGLTLQPSELEACRSVAWEAVREES